MKNKFTTTLLFFSFFLIAGCSKNENLTDKTFNSEEHLTTTESEKKSDMNKFAAVLSKAVSQDPSIRTFIKQKALQEEDHDYDVFYNFVKDEEVENNKSFRQKLLEYSDNKDSFSIIESRLPLLTIFVPELPSGFNAENWDAANEEPAITSFVSYSQREMQFYKRGTASFTLQSNEIPGFPTLVIKNNERIQLSNKAKDNLNISKINTTAFVKQDFKFIDSIFDNTSPKNVTKLSNTRCAV